MDQKQANLKIGNYIFLSYARSDSEKIEKLRIAHKLVELGYLVVIDEGHSWKWNKQERCFVHEFRLGSLGPNK